MLAALMIIPVKTEQISGLVVNQKDSCFVLRSDDNQLHQICRAKADTGSKVQVTLSYPFLSFSDALYQKLDVLRESDELSRMIQAMSIKEKMGHMLVIRTQNHLSRKLDFVPGGYILFSDDFEAKSEAEIIAMTEKLKESGALLMVDEEGGKVARVSKALYGEGFASVQQLYHDGGWQAVEENLIEKSRFLKKLGLHVNLNPVADVCEDETAFIYPRSFGQNAEMTSAYVQLAVKIQKQEDIISCLKHFPGYGTNLDTHEGFSVERRTLEEFQKRDFLPFVSGIQEGVELVMMSHVVMSAVDDEHPASLSKKAVDLLRHELNFTSVIMTDDLTMEAVEALGVDSLVEAVLAGCDLLLTTDPDVDIDSLVSAAEDNVFSLNQIDESVLRILFLKQKAGLSWK